MRRSSRAALTLVEMLVAMAVTLIMMGAVVTMFGNVGNSITASRAMMEISERLRNCRNVLQTDLGNITVTMQPSRRPEMDEGYFEYIEGPVKDTDSMAQPAPNPLPAGYGLLGDADDILMFTARSRGTPYTAQFNNLSAESLTAEIIYYTAVALNTPTIIDSTTGNQTQLLTLYRRVLLVSPSNGRFDPVSLAPPVNSRNEFYDRNDLSVAYDGTTFNSNTLGDLTKRENRYGRDTTGAFPWEVIRPTVAGSSVIPFTAAGGRAGDDVILTNVLSFDVRLYDPGAPVSVVNGVAVGPSDPGSAPTTPSAFGAYVDLGYPYNPANVTTITPPQPRFNLLNFNSAMSGLTTPTYDTWSMHYQAFSAANDGLDSNGNGIVDEPAERTADAPFASPLRGIQIKIRVYEPDSRQVREVTVVQDFLPQSTGP